jgi:hypothetical protein
MSNSNIAINAANNNNKSGRKGSTSSASSNKLLSLLKIAQKKAAKKADSESPASSSESDKLFCPIGPKQRLMSQSLSQTKLMLLSEDDGGIYKGPSV